MSFFLPALIIRQRGKSAIFIIGYLSATHFCTALPFDIREDLRCGFQDAQVLVRGEQVHPLQAAFLQA